MRHCKPFIFVAFCTCSVFEATCKPDDFSPLDNLKETVHRVVEAGTITGSDDKLLSRSGDMAALAVVKALPDAELTTPDNIARVLDVVHLSFSCLDRCVESCSDRQPRLTLLLLDHLHQHSTGRLRARVEDTRKFVLRESYRVWLDSPAN
jgi:hypothetical protein